MDRDETDLRDEWYCAYEPLRTVDYISGLGVVFESFLHGRDRGSQSALSRCTHLFTETDCREKYKRGQERDSECECVCAYRKETSMINRHTKKCRRNREKKGYDQQQTVS